MSNLPGNLRYLANRMSGFSTNTFRLETENQSSATSGSIVSVNLPSNSIINLRSFKMFFNATANKDTALHGARLPKIKSLIERMEVSLGGVVLSQGTNFTNVLSEAKCALQEKYTDATLGHPEYMRTKSYSQSTGLTAGGNLLPKPYAAAANEDDANLYCVDEWEGFMGTAHPTLFDTSIVPMIKIRLYMASDNVLSISKTVVLGSAAASFADSTTVIAAPGIGSTGPPSAAVGANAPLIGARYEISNIFFTIECVSIADMAYENMLAAQMEASGGFLEVPYKAYYTFLDTHSGSTRFSVASSSMDRIWLAWRGANYNTQDTVNTISGYKLNGGFTSTTAGAATATDQGLPQYDQGGVLDTNEEKYLGKYFNFSQPVAYGTQPVVDWTLQLQLNGAMMPQFQARPEALYGMTRNSLEYQKRSKKMTYDQYLNNYCIQCFRLNLPESEFSRMLSGIDTRSSNLAGIVNTNNALTAAQPNLMVFVECSEILRVGMGRAINVVV